MIVVDRAVISDDVKDKFFVCNLEKCKGACCVEGDMGAPLEEEEVSIIEDIYDTVKPYLSPEGIKAIEEQGTWVIDEDGDFSTPTIGNRECAYAIYDEKKHLHCGIERAFYDGKIDYKKPISCHLYPIRVTKYEEYDALNYDKWSICSDACTLGSVLNVPVYKFLKEPLVRKYGAAWYKQLEDTIEQQEPTQ
jgi:hypothetical protein